MSQPSKIMLIRHAERPADVHAVPGVTGAPYGALPDGDRDINSLSIAGWQRAGALASLFDPSRGPLQDSRLAVPNALFATAVAQMSTSKREQQTITPLASTLGLAITAKYSKRKPKDVVKDVLASEGVVLIAWDHKFLTSIARELVGGNTPIPKKWKGKRFDLVWVFDWNESTKTYDFCQVPQLLLAGDSKKVMKVKKPS
jgi:hypothetical protein